MTPPRPTDETPSAAAVAKKVIAEWRADYMIWMSHADNGDSLLQKAFVLALDAHAREREAAVWEAAIKLAIENGVSSYVIGKLRTRATEMKKP